MTSSVLDVIGSEVRNMRWPQLLAADMQRKGLEVPNGDGNIIRAATSSVGGLGPVVGTVNASVMRGFLNGPDTTQGWVRVVDLPNFLLSEIACVDTPPRLEKLARGQPAIKVNFSVLSQGWRLARFAANFTISEEDMIDGQTIGVYQVAHEEIGKAARRIGPDLVYSTLLANGVLSDGLPIFDASRGNLGSVSLNHETNGIDVGLGAILGQVAADEAGDPVHLGLTATHLIVPPRMLGLGRRQARLMATGVGDLIVRGESRLGTAGVVNPANDTIVEGTAQNWLLAVSANQTAGVVIGARGGKVEPTIRTYQLSQGEFGIGIDIVLDLACTVVDPRALYFSTGNG